LECGIAERHGTAAACVDAEGVEDTDGDRSVRNDLVNGRRG
jgi:hypothetical protein